MKVKNYTYFKASFRFLRSVFPSHIKTDGKTVRPAEILFNSFQETFDSPLQHVHDEYLWTWNGFGSINNLKNLRDVCESSFCFISILCMFKVFVYAEGISMFNV